MNRDVDRAMRHLDKCGFGGDEGAGIPSEELIPLEKLIPSEKLIVWKSNMRRLNAQGTAFPMSEDEIEETAQFLMKKWPSAYTQRPDGEARFGRESYR
jgi:hypothetical protein